MLFPFEVDLTAGEKDGKRQCVGNKATDRLDW